MLVKLVHSLNEVEEITVAATNLKEILNYIKFSKGVEVTDKIVNGYYKYVLMDSAEQLEPVGLLSEVIFSEIEGYDTLLIIPEIQGEGVAIVAFLAGITASAVAASVTLSIAAALINIVIAIAVSAIISLLSPTPEFSSDPSQAQLKQSSLFNGAPLIREQGGSVPLVYGNPFCGGVLISSGVSTEDII